MLKLFNYLLILNIFLGGFTLFTSPFEFYVGYLFMISFLVVFPLHYPGIGLNRRFVLILVGITGLSLVSVYLGNNSFASLAKQLFGILLTGSAYYLLIRANGYDIERLFRIYLRIALVVAAIGVFQELSYLIGFEAGYNYRSIIPKWDFTFAGSDLGFLRVNSILPEPSHFAISMAPAVFVSLASIAGNMRIYLLNKIARIIILMSVILTFSAVAYVAILTSILLVYSIGRKAKYVFAGLIIVSICAVSAYMLLPEITMRVDDTYRVATGSMESAEANLSTFALTSNAFVAYNSVIDSPIFGHGLGSHSFSYDKFISSLPGNVISEDVLGLNREDANSLFLRLGSETGLLGIVLAFAFICRFYLRGSDDKHLQIVNNAAFIMLIMYLLRQGHYFVNGFPFFIWLYYLSYKIACPSQECRRGPASWGCCGRLPDRFHRANRQREKPDGIGRRRQSFMGYHEPDKSRDLRPDL